MPDFDDLPFSSRPDLTPYLIHLTKNTKAEDEFSAYDNLANILRSGEIWGSRPQRGFIKGKRKAACFMDVPFASLKYVLTPEDADPQAPRYEPYGVVITKRYAYGLGCRPVLYLSNAEVEALGVPANELWRVVRLEVRDGGNWISWLHEREWRRPDRFKLPPRIQAVLVRSTRDARNLARLIAKDPKDFACTPSAIIPLTVMSQGLLV